MMALVIVAMLVMAIPFIGQDRFDRVTLAKLWCVSATVWLIVCLTGVWTEDDGEQIFWGLLAVVWLAFLVHDIYKVGRLIDHDNEGEA